VESERRQFTRYAVERDEFEIFCRQTGINGTLKDISMGGLAYQYSPSEGDSPPSEVIDILGKSPERFYLQGLVCQRIYDIIELTADHTFRGMEIKLKGLAFTGLSEKQRQQLEDFFEKYDVSES